MNSNIKFLQARALTISLLLPYRYEMPDCDYSFAGWFVVKGSETE